jgi:site-specific recombinase XerD
MTKPLWKMLLTRNEAVFCETDLVFHSAGPALQPGKVRKASKRAIKAAGFSERIHFHSLRHVR